jgi:ankyrin repeat protein
MTERLHCTGPPHYGHLEVVEALLAAQADVNKASNDGETPLHWASYKGHLEVVKALLAAQADVNKANDEVDSTVQGLRGGALGGGQGPACGPGRREQGHNRGETPLYGPPTMGAQADVNKANDEVRLHCLLLDAYNHTEIAALLREAGAHE